jgi:hypothetical protein
MNANHQPQEERRVAERLAHLEMALDYQGQAIAGLHEETRAGFARVDAEFVRVHEQLMKIRTTDFRILLSICLTTALGTVGLVIKIFGLS